MEIFTVGGYNEVGKNMTVVKIGDDVIIFDIGLYLPAVVDLQESEQGEYSEKKLRNIGALPDDTILDQLGLRDKVRAILVGHAHLDHVGAIPYLGYRYNAPVIGTPFTTTVLKKIVEDDKGKLSNQIKTVQPNSSFIIKGKRDYKVDFINITHSTIQTSMIALHTPEGVVLYANDFKLDKTPILGLPPNYDTLKQIAKEGVKVLIVDSLYSGDERKTPSEKIARDLIEEVLVTTENEKNAIFVATFSSHIARLKSIVDFSKKLDRDVLFVGRSLKKYVSSSIDVGMCPFKNDIKIASYKKEVLGFLKRVEKQRDKYLVVCTGHQGEPGSVLERLSRKDLPFEFKKNDNIIFSSKTIPTPVNLANRGQVDKRLKNFGVRIFDNVHVSGHAGREDLRDLLTIINPQNIIPAHGTLQQMTPMVELAREVGYRVGKECHLMQDGQKIKL